MEKLTSYYHKKNVHDYPKTKQGNPDMRAIVNKNTLKTLEETTCPICYEPMTNGHATLPCKHEFCLSCIIQHGRLCNECPLCLCEFATKPNKKPSYDLNNIQPQMIQPIHENVFQIKSYTYKNEYIDFMDYLLIQFKTYSKKNNPLLFVQTTMKGIRQLLNLSSRGMILLIQQEMNTS